MSIGSGLNNGKSPTNFKKSIRTVKKSEVYPCQTVLNGSKSPKKTSKKEMRNLYSN